MKKQKRAYIKLNLVETNVCPGSSNTCETCSVYCHGTFKPCRLISGVGSREITCWRQTGRLIGRIRKKVFRIILQSIIISENCQRLLRFMLCMTFVNLVIEIEQSVTFAWFVLLLFQLRIFFKFDTFLPRVW